MLSYPKLMLWTLSILHYIYLFYKSYLIKKKTGKPSDLPVKLEFKKELKKMLKI